MQFFPSEVSDGLSFADRLKPHKTAEPFMKTTRFIVWIMIAIVAGIGGYAWLSKNLGQDVTQAPAIKLGGPFNLVKHTGAPITEADFAGRNHAIFFGFTNCPDICPTTLMQTAGWLKKLGPDSDRLDFYFFSVDPERDTSEILNDYVMAFDPRITGVTGNPEEMSRTIKLYRAYAQRVDLDDGDYTMDHSAFVMLFSSNGDFKGTISFDENEDTAMAKLRRLIDNG